MAASLENLSSVLQTLIKPNSTPEKWLSDRYTSPPWYKQSLEQNTKTLNIRTAHEFRSWSIPVRQNCGEGLATWNTIAWPGHNSKVNKSANNKELFTRAL